jgi:hypothetical protein
LIDNTWRDGLNKYELLDTFQEIFYRDLESWFNAFTFYCDSCVDEFIQNWPGIYHRDEEFQRNAIPIDTFYDGSRRVRECFNKDEFTSFLCDLGCPNCKENHFHNIWPYDMGFSVPHGFNNYLVEIADLAEKTPFLLMTHPFAQQVYKEIETISRNTSSTLHNNLFYRARNIEENKIYSSTDFLAADKSLIKEGRYNHAGNQVLYLGDNELTCFRELRSPVEGVMVAEILITVHLRILDLSDETLEDNDIMQAILHSTMMSSPAEGEGWNKPHYVFTRYVADVAKATGFDAIRYPSVRNDEGFNLVVLNFQKIRPAIIVGKHKRFRP